MFGLQLALAVLPCAAIVYLIYRADLYEKEDVFPLLICFLLGVLITFPLFELQALFDRLGWLVSGTLVAALVSSFILVSLTEESLKFLTLRLYPYTRSFFNEPIDGIVYSTTIAMGFAMLENIFYAYQYELSTTLVRGITAVPAHASFAAIMGYFVGRARFNPAKRKRFLLMGLLLPIGIHGLYDFFIIQEVYDGLIILSLLTLSIALFFSIRLVREQQGASPFRENDAKTTNEREEP
ncbi:MAG TPA: PrsW family glutamic-type intramembrane protease [Saprospiraceae bacterium]|nr:PrsW family glutamic-type intramembrane protease [Saprospiraceae bacterium]